LFRYFTVTDARIGVLTNGIVYRFFTDLEAQNKMDDRPFLEVDMLDLKETVVEELKKLTKPAFNPDDLMTAAGDSKYTREIKRLLAEQIENPSDEFRRVRGRQINYLKTTGPSAYPADAHAAPWHALRHLRRAAQGADGVVEDSAPRPRDALERPRVREQSGVAALL
jgi:hypothetical protein